MRALNDFAIAHSAHAKYANYYLIRGCNSRLAKSQFRDLIKFRHSPNGLSAFAKNENGTVSGKTAGTI